MVLRITVPIAKPTTLMTEFAEQIYFCLLQCSP